MLIGMTLMGMVQVSIMKVVSMSLVLDSGVPARGTMFVRMFFVSTTCFPHNLSLPLAIAWQLV
jgi:hypothetical protein